MVNFLNLKYFVMIAEEGNITRVAESEHVSQQSLSSHIKKLEKSFGVRLFERGNGISLTYAGERVYEYAVRLLRTKSDMENELLDLTESGQGVLRIGISYTRGCAFLPEILPTFRAENPFVKTDITENNSQVLEEYLLRGHIDLYIGANLRHQREIEITDLCSEKLFLVIPKTTAEEIYGTTHGLFLPEKPLEVFLKYDFLMLSKANRIRKMIDECLEKKELCANILIETENIETLFELSCRGMGITIYPEMFLKKHTELLKNEDASIRLVPVAEKGCESTLSVGYNKNRYLSSAAKRFIDIAKSLLGEENTTQSK